MKIGNLHLHSAGDRRAFLVPKDCGLIIEVEDNNTITSRATVRASLSCAEDEISVLAVTPALALEAALLKMRKHIQVQLQTRMLAIDMLLDAITPAIYPAITPDPSKGS